MNPHIVALQSAEQQLRDHDKRIADASAELKTLKLERKDIDARVKACIDVLCGRSPPDLFTGVDEHRADGAAEYQAANPPTAVPTSPATEFAPQGDQSVWCDLVPPFAGMQRPGAVYEPEGVHYPKRDDWRKQGLALLGLNEKLLKACKKEEVLTVGDLHDWIDEETRDEGGLFGPGVLARELSRIGKIAAKWGEANAEILYQFFADKGFAGVPEKEAA
jgi:hypothetical protein